MAKRPTLTDITSLTNSSNINAINQNWDAIQEAFNNTLSLDGSTPNAMNSDLDLNGNALLNVGTIDVENLSLNGQQVTDISTVPEWRGAWATATTYFRNDLVRSEGSSYICLQNHTSGIFSIDLINNRWELFAQQGAAGSGTGDMVAANNLSDLTNTSTARANLGLGTVATENTVPIAKGGTGATDATTARTNLSAQTLNANLTSLSGITLVQGDLLYATGPDTLVRLPKGTANQVLRMNSGATAPEWASENAIGVGQTWQDVTGSRSASTSYQNTTGRPIVVAISTSGVTGNHALEVSTNNSSWLVVSASGSASALISTNRAIVPPGHYYRYTGNIAGWRELR